MELQFISIGGQHKNLDYQDIEDSLRKIFGKTCKEATVIIINRFPILVTSGIPLDFILIISIRDFQGNYFRIKKGEKWVYLNNLIIPVVINNSYKEKEIKIGSYNEIKIDKSILDFTEEILSIKKNIRKYFVSRCYFNDMELFISPIIFIKNQFKYACDNILISNLFNGDSLVYYLQQNTQKTYFCSYKPWKSDLGTAYLEEKCKEILNQASLDSRLGYLTKKKIERITAELTKGNKIFYNSDTLTIINGNAGTGKSSRLISAMMNCISNGINSLFLTYNRLLVFDISTVIHGFLNDEIDKNLLGNELGSPTVTTLHAYFKSLSKALGPLYVLSDNRRKEIILNLESRITIVKEWINISLAENNEWEKEQHSNLKTKIQNDVDLSIEVKEVGIDWLNYLIKTNFSENALSDTHVALFLKSKLNLLEKIGDEIFLQDYYNVLQQVLNVIRDPEQYFITNNLLDKYDLLKIIFNLPVEDMVNSSKYKLNCAHFVEIISDKLNSMRSNTCVFVDEGQDCHHLEKEILISLFGSGNLMVANGGREQLIRHPILCKWDIFNSKKINARKVSSSIKSLRVKKSILNLCNFIAIKFGVNLNLIELEMDDPGEIIFDFRQKPSSLEVKEVIGTLCLKSTIMGCTALEGLLILIDSRSVNDHGKRTYGESITSEFHSAQINENGNLEPTITKKRYTWSHKNFLVKELGLLIWDGTIKDKSQLPIPYSTETRLIYYESCRGLEGWAVACYDIDSFYSRKKNSSDSEKFLNDAEKEFGIQDLHVTSEERKNAFAAAWILMAITRAIDTLYLNIEDESSELGKLFREFIDTNPGNIRVYDISNKIL